MDAVFGDTDEEQIGVTVYDNESNKHRLLIGWDGAIKLHVTDEYPTDEADRTEEEETIIQQVRRKALHTAHIETDADLIDPNWDPAVLERAITAIENLSDEAFREQFEDYYHDLQDPPVDVPIERVVVLIKTLQLNGETLVDTSHTMVDYETADGYELSRKTDLPDADVSLNMPPFEINYSFGEQFRVALVHHLKCQIRDVYLRMGDDPPNEYAVDGYGKPRVE